VEGGLSGPEDLPGVDDLLGSFRWYDALCINQEDTQERNHQVNQMGQIYGEADCVITWLGPVVPEEDERVRNLFTRMIEQLKQRASVQQLALRYHAAFGHPMPIEIDDQFAPLIARDFWIT
jgi:hypothetical protein